MKDLYSESFVFALVGLIAIMLMAMAFQSFLESIRVPESFALVVALILSSGVTLATSVFLERRK